MGTSPEADIAEAARTLLREGPLALSTLVRRLETGGVLGPLHDAGLADDGEIGEALVDEILDGDDVWVTSDETLVLADTLTDGLVLTHRASDEEIALGRVEILPDLVVLDWDAEHGLELLGPGGGRLTTIVDEVRPGQLIASLVGPDGWLTAFDADQLLAFRRRGRSVEVFAAGEVGDGGREIEGLRATIEGRILPGQGEEAVPLVLDALAADPDAFRRPVPPLHELLDGAGLDRRGHNFGRRGEAWTTFSERYQDSKRSAIEQEWQFEACCREAFDHVDAAYRGMGQEGEADLDAKAVRRSLGHGDVAAAFLEYVAGRRAADRAPLAAFADLLLVDASDDAAPAHLLAAVAAELDGQLTAAEAHLRRADRLDHDSVVTAAILARYQLDRGDVAGAIASLRHPDLDPDSPTLRFLVALQARLDQPYLHVGRNQACPCGSGRKYKQCCQRNRSVPLADRTALLAHKVAVFAHRPEHRIALEEVVAAAVDPDEPDTPTAVGALWGNSIIVDIGLWEGGLAGEYLEERGELLPLDERELLTHLVATPRRLWELAEVDEGVRLVLRDTRSGETVSVDEHLGSIGRQPGELMLTRVALVDEVHQLFGAAIDVPLALRDSAMRLVDAAPDAAALAAWYGRAIGPPRLTNGEGEPSVLCHAEVTTDEAAEAVGSALDTAFEREDDRTWIAPWEGPGGDSFIRGTIRIDDGHVSVDTNSVERMEWLLARLTAALPDARVSVDERVPLAELTDVPPPAGGPPPTPLAGSTGAETELAMSARGHEPAWLDEPVLALGGLTPRQAVDDPTRREDLLTVLREMVREATPVEAEGTDEGRTGDQLGQGARDGTT